MGTGRLREGLRDGSVGRYDWNRERTNNLSRSSGSIPLRALCFFPVGPITTTERVSKWTLLAWWRIVSGRLAPPISGSAR
jgi:hypothetical protein